MFNPVSNAAGKNYDQFMHAAMLSKARIEEAWSKGQDEQPEEKPREVEQPSAFDPAMLAALAQRAATGNIQEAAPPAQPAGSAPASGRRRFAGFSKEVLEAANSYYGEDKGPAAPAVPHQRSAQEKDAFRQRLTQETVGAPAPDGAGAPRPPVSFSMGGDSSSTAPQGAAEDKNASAAAMKDIVAKQMEQAKNAAASTAAFHAAAPEPKPADSRPRRRRFDDEPAVPGDGQAEGSGGKMALSHRELAALSRGAGSADAPALGELRAPAQPNTGAGVDDHGAKTGQQLFRDNRERAMGRLPTQVNRSKSRSRDRDRDRKKKRSPSGKRKQSKLFTETPSYRLTGSTFTTVPQTQEVAKAAPAAPAMNTADLPDWLKDMAEPQPAFTTAAKLGKKYLHIPRIMVEVLTHNGGEALRQCEMRSQCQIRIETMIEEPVGIVSVNGNVAMGEAIIKETLANKGLDMPAQTGLTMPYAGPANQQPREDLQQDIQIPDSLVRHFVGHKGCNMKALHAELDRRHGGARTVSIQILPAVLPGGFRRIQITGSNRVEARRLVLEQIETLKKQQNLTMMPSNDPTAQPSTQQYGYRQMGGKGGVSI